MSSRSPELVDGRIAECSVLQWGSTSRSPDGRGMQLRHSCSAGDSGLDTLAAVRASGTSRRSGSRFCHIADCEHRGDLDSESQRFSLRDYRTGGDRRGTRARPGLLRPPLPPSARIQSERARSITRPGCVICPGAQTLPPQLRLSNRPGRASRPLVLPGNAPPAGVPPAPKAARPAGCRCRSQSLSCLAVSPGH